MKVKTLKIDSALSQELKNELAYVRGVLRKHTDRAYLVGGCVRDFLLGIRPKDLDIEVYGVDETTFAAIMESLGATGVGKSFFVYKYKNIDISLPRIEKKIARGHRGFSVALADQEHIGCMRRDFRVNALLCNLFSGELLDFFDGDEDLKNRCLRIVSKEHFKEDSLRVLRAARFASTLGFSIFRGDIEEICSIPLDDLSKERIANELEKLFGGTYPEKGIYYLLRLGILEKLLGMNVEREKAFTLLRSIKKHKPYFLPHLREYYSLYFLCGILGLDIKETCDRLSLPNRYKNRLKTTPFALKPSLKEIAEVAVEYAIGETMLSCYPEIIALSKESRFFDTRFVGGIEAKEIELEGFRGKELGEELKTRKVRAFLINFNANFININ